MTGRSHELSSPVRWQRTWPPNTRRPPGKRHAGNTATAAPCAKARASPREANRTTWYGPDGRESTNVERLIRCQVCGNEEEEQ